jgi:hypothetical protein
MKTQIIKLEKHDDVISTQDKLAWGKTARLLLVLPDEGRILTRRIDLVILQRYCQAQGSQLGLVTQDPLVRANAQLIGIPIFSNETKALKTRWNKRNPRRTREPHALPDLRTMRREIKSTLSPDDNSNKIRVVMLRWVRLGFFTIAILSVLALAGVFFPSAAIELSPETKTEEVILRIMAASQIKAVNISGSLPARTIAAVVEEQDKIPVTGSASIADQYAFGEVQFTNLGNQIVVIPAGTIVDDIQEANARFITTRKGLVEAGTGKTSYIPIQALLPGPDGNLPAGAIDAIEGPLGLQISVSNLDPTTGGTNKQVLAVSAKDYDNLHTQMIQGLKQIAYQQIESKLTPGDLLIQATLDIKNILDEESNPGINQPANYLSISLRIEYSALYISADDLKLIGTTNLDASLDHHFRPVSGSLLIETVDDPQVGTDHVILCRIKASRLTQLILPEEEVTAMILGMTPEEASRKLSNKFSLTETPKVIMTPKWWPQIPIMAFRISISQGSYADSGG